MGHRFLGARLVALLAIVPIASRAQPWSPDAGPGHYRNPIVFADYSDPDVVRVGDDFYMTASSFGHVPGLPILHSKDLVHWTLVNHAIQRLTPEFDVPQHGNGVWAPSIRAHGGWFYIYYGDPDRGIYVVRTRDIRGTWDAPVLVRAAKGWIDPAPFWDDDGNAYLVHAYARSRSGIKHRLDVARMSPDGLHLLDDGALVFMDSTRHPTMEGPKLYKRDGWYYIFAPAGGVPTGWQTVLRSRSPLGPYEDRIVLAQGTTAVNGPHQGAWITAPNGSDWFAHFQDRGAYGRIVHLEPMTWRDGWPVIGADPDGDGTGEPVATWRIPVRSTSHAGPATSDEFDARTLGLQWQWQANPQRTWYSLADRPGALRLNAQPSAGPTLWSAPNVLLQKLPAPTFTATARIIPHAAAPGEIVGLTIFGLDYAYVGIRRTTSGYELVDVRAHDADRATADSAGTAIPIAAGPVHLRVSVREVARDSAECQFAYSTDGVRFTPIGAPFRAREGKWVGAKVGLFAIAPRDATARGYADVEWFRVR